MVKKGKLCFAVKNDQTYRQGYANLLIEIATERTSAQVADKIKELKCLKIKPWLNLLTAFCYITGVRPYIVKRWLDEKNAKECHSDFIDAYEFAKTLVGSRLAGGMLDNNYRKDVVEALMWWGFKERIMPPREINAGVGLKEMPSASCGFFALEKALSGE